MIRLGTLLLVSSAVAISLWLVRPPAALPETAPATEFSSGRAMKHLRAIAQQPHPVGSAENARVRQYLLEELVKLGLEVQLQQSSSWNVWTNQPVSLQNIVARQRGTERGSAVMLLCHYDSVPGGPGAADDASAVAAVLESLRALRASPPLRNDLIILITDAEEAGLLGAQAFVRDHPWLNHVELVFNFEARGNGGPAVLMQSGYDSGWLIREFAKVAPYPIGSSFGEDVFKRLPNDTDFTIFRNAGKAGLNFAFFKGLHYYHTAHDTVDNLDERSVQHHGSNCLALARHFGNLNMDQTRGPDVVFFNLIGPLMVYYPLKWCVPISVLSVATFLGTVVAGFRMRRLSLWQIAAGLLLQLVIMAAAPAIVAGLWASISSLPAVQQATSRGDLARADVFTVAVAAICFSTFVAIHACVPNRISALNRAIGALSVWVILTIFTGAVLPRGNYFFSWPLLFSSTGICVLLTRNDVTKLSGWRLGFLWGSCLPGILLMTPGCYLIAITVGMSRSWITAICIAGQWGLLIPQVNLIIGDGLTGFGLRHQMTGIPD